jgi:1-acyl-sn-glycerol-3-phosphate acyltransferase
MVGVTFEARPTDLLAGTLHGDLRQHVMGAALAILRRILPLRVVGSELVPQEGPLLVVSNHLSNADPPLLTIAFPRTVFFMGKSELFRVPGLGWLIRRLGGFPVTRGTPDRVALRHALAVLDQGIAMGIYPEGGRSKTGAMVRGFPGAGLLALQSRAPILPVAIYGTEYFPVNGEWPPRRPRSAESGVTIRFGHPFRIPERVDGKRVTSEEATRLLMSQVAELLPEKYRGVYALDSRANA